MKRNIRITFAILAAGLMTHSLSAQTVDVTASQGATIGWNSTNAALAGESGHYYPSELKTRSYDGTSSGNASYYWKGYIQFNLSSAWANYGEANLSGATLTMYNMNGTGRHFDVWGMANDGLGTGGLEGWDAASLTASNAPANLLTSLQGFDPSLTYDGTYIYSMNGGGVDQTANYPGTTLTQLASYTSPVDLSSFLKTDSDGLVTFMIDGYNNMGWVNAPYSGQNLANGEISPYLTLTFVPEPGVLSLVALGLSGFFFVARRRK